MTSGKYQIDMCHGGLFGKIILFSLPLVFTYILQLLFNAMDLVVIGHYASHESMAAIGATMNLNSFVINLFVGLSIGSNVIVARSLGAGDKESVRKANHTSMAVSFYGGIILTVIALLIAKPMLIRMETPPEILHLSCKYIWICFLAIPFIMIYNFGCASLRAAGDTRRPLYYLVIAGVINVSLNLFFVIRLKMDVGGVALATAISHCVSAILIVLTLIREKEELKLNLRQLAIDARTMKEMLKIGIPAGIQSTCFSVSNMIIQSSINSFGSYAIAGSTACIAWEGVVYVGSYAFHQTALSFVAQNLGGQQYKRIRNSIWQCMLGACLITGVLGWGFYLFSEPTLSLMNPEPQVIAWGAKRMKVLFTTYMLCGIMDVSTGSLRGLGYSLVSTLICLFGACILRMWWIWCIFPHRRTYEFLFISYPVSWSAVAIMGIVLLVILYRHTVRNNTAPVVTWAPKGHTVPRGYRFIGKPK